MVVAVVKETLELLNIKGALVKSVPCQIKLSDRYTLIVSLTDFGQVLFGVICENNRTLKWTNSDIVEFFIDEDTQFFIENSNVCFAKSSESIGFSVTYAEEKIQVFNLVDFIEKSIAEIDRFVDDFTPI